MAEQKVTVDLGGKELTISTGKWAKLAGGSAVVQLGGTIEGNVAARTDSWPKVLAFLARHLER